jgi:hypothetical protein
MGETAPHRPFPRGRGGVEVFASVGDGGLEALEGLCLHHCWVILAEQGEQELLISPGVQDRVR